jgi:hypothetical protein
VRSPARNAGESVFDTPMTAAGWLGPMPISPIVSTISSGLSTRSSCGTIVTSTRSLPRNTLIVSSRLGLFWIRRRSSSNV